MYVMEIFDMCSVMVNIDMSNLVNGWFMFGRRMVFSVQVDMAAAAVGWFGMTWGFMVIVMLSFVFRSTVV